MAGHMDTLSVWDVLDLVVAEWESDPMSVQCFDLRIVERAKHLVKVRKTIRGKDELEVAAIWARLNELAKTNPTAGGVVKAWKEAHGV